MAPVVMVAEKCASMILEPRAKALEVATSVNE